MMAVSKAKPKAKRLGGQRDARGHLIMTAKQKAFVEEYLKDLSQKYAAIRAGFSARSAEEQGRKLMMKPHIAKAIADAIEARSKRTKIDADWLLKRLAEEAEADVGDLYDDAGRLKAVRDWPPIWRKGLVAGIDIEAIGDSGGTVTKLKISDRVKRLELIGKHVDVQAFRERIEHSGSVNIVVTSDDAAL